MLGLYQYVYDNKNAYLLSPQGTSQSLKLRAFFGHGKYRTRNLSGQSPTLYYQSYPTGHVMLVILFSYQFLCHGDTKKDAFLVGLDFKIIFFKVKVEVVEDFEYC